MKQPKPVIHTQEPAADHSQSPDQPILVLTTMPDNDSAQTLAHLLVSERLAACVNILAPCTSVYEWQGQLETSSEIPLMIKSTATRYPALEAAIRSHHPYELPEILHVPVSGGLPAYLDWISQHTTSRGIST